MPSDNIVNYDTFGHVPLKQSGADAMYSIVRCSCVSLLSFDWVCFVVCMYYNTVSAICPMFVFDNLLLVFLIPCEHG